MCGSHCVRILSQCAGQGRAGRRRLDWNPALLAKQRRRRLANPDPNVCLSSNMDILRVPRAMSLDSIICRIKQSRS